MPRKRSAAPLRSNCSSAAATSLGPVDRRAGLVVVGLDLRRVEAGLGDARPEVLHAHRRAGQLASQRLAEAAQAELGGAVDREARQGQSTEHRAHVEHRRATLRLQPRQQGPRQQHRRHQVGRHGLQDVRIVQRAQAPEARHAGVVDEHVGATGQRRTPHRFDAGTGREIRGQHLDAPRVVGVGLECPRQGRQPAGMAADEQQARAGLGQRARHGRTDAARGAGEHHAAVLEFEAHHAARAVAGATAVVARGSGRLRNTSP